MLDLDGQSLAGAQQSLLGRSQVGEACQDQPRGKGLGRDVASHQGFAQRGFQASRVQPALARAGLAKVVGPAQEGLSLLFPALVGLPQGGLQLERANDLPGFGGQAAGGRQVEKKIPLRRALEHSHPEEALLPWCH